MNHKVTLMNDKGECVSYSIHSNYTKNEVVERAIEIAEEKFGCDWFLDSVVEVSE